MTNTTQVTLLDMVECIVESLKLANPNLHEHSVVTARIAYGIGQSYGLNSVQQRDLVVCSLLHCVGTLITNFEFNSDKLQSKIKRVYCRSMYKILSKCSRMENISNIFKCLIFREDINVSTKIAKIQSDIVRLSCYIARELDLTENSLVQKSQIVETANNNCIDISTKVKEAFLNVTNKDCFWLHIVSPSARITQLRLKKIKEFDTMLTYKEICSFAIIIAYMIDFKSPNTINHSYGVAITSYYLGVLCGLPDEECDKLKIAGYVHDIGKLGVPDEILYKASKLSQVEFSYIKKHPYDTYRVLEKIKGLKDVRDWAAYHHEKPDGKGYPFNIYAQDLPIQCRILTIADVFSALREDRMYRKRFPKEKVIFELKKMFSESQKDIEIVNLLIKHYEKIELARMVAEVDSYNQYVELIEAVGGKANHDICSVADRKASYLP